MDRKEKELKVLALFDLKIGDKIKVEDDNNFILEIKEVEDRIVFERKKESGTEYLFTNVLTIYDWKKVEPPLKDKKCKEFEQCNGCPFSNRKNISCSYVIDVTEEKTLAEIYKDIEQDLYSTKQKIYGEEK